MTDLRTVLQAAAAEPRDRLDLDLLARRARSSLFRRVMIWLAGVGAIVTSVGGVAQLQPADVHEPDRESVGIERPAPTPERQTDGSGGAPSAAAPLVDVTAGASEPSAPSSVAAAPMSAGGAPPAVPRTAPAADQVVDTAGPMLLWVEVPHFEDNGPIHAYDIRTGNDRVVAFGVMPSMAPDRQRLVYFVTPADGDCAGGRGGARACPAPGTYVKRLDEEGPGRRISTYAEWPDWSPTADLIAFTKYGSDAFASGEAQFQLYVMNADGTGERRLTSDPARSAADPAWSPDGTQIAFSLADVRGEAPWGTSAIYVINADGSGLRAVTDTAPKAGGPAWSPDGRYIAFTEYEDATGRGTVLRVADLQTQATRTIVGDQNPGGAAWSIDGGTIFYLAAIGFGGGMADQASLWAVSPDGSGRRRLLDPNGVGMFYLEASS